MEACESTPDVVRSRKLKIEDSDSDDEPIRANVRPKKPALANVKKESKPEPNGIKERKPETRKRERTQKIQRSDGPDSDDDEPIKKKPRHKNSKTESVEDNYEKGDARRHFKEGQVKVTPRNGDALRAFYETLLEDQPTSVIAIKWCIEAGTLAGAEHTKFLKKYNELKKLGAFRKLGGVHKEWVNLLSKK